MADERVRVELGFEGGQVIGGFVDAASAEELERARLTRSGPRVVVLDTEDGPLPRRRRRMSRTYKRFAAPAASGSARAELRS